MDIKMVGSDGLEPSMSLKTTDLQSVAIAAMRTTHFKNYPSWIRTMTHSAKNCGATVTPKGNVLRI